NVMITTPAFVAEDGGQARDLAVRSGLGYFQSNLFRYHDSVAKPPYVPAWPELVPEPVLEDIDPMATSGMIICGDPYEALEQIQRWESASVDQLVLNLATSTFSDAA